jgi:hypothetical protein
LRHIADRAATVWVETSEPCVVEVLGHTAPTFTAFGHHYAIVAVTDLQPATTTPYQVRLDDETVWPEPDPARPPSVIRTLDPDRPLRIVFGSCRHATPADLPGRYAPDALDTYSTRLAGSGQVRWPDALLLLGDQVYGDETSTATQEWIAGRRDVSVPPGTEVANFEEYTHLYRESWSDPDVRWLLSTVPTSMIFDDHDIRDDWNTSGAWRADMRTVPWWKDRITGGLASYWIYQHLGNLTPQALAADPVLAEVRKVSEQGGDAGELLLEFATNADAEAAGAKGYRWSYRLDLGRTRVVVIDSRCGRILDGHQRLMIGETDLAWLTEQLDGDYDHLLLGTSLPWLLPPAIHDLEVWNETICDSPRPRIARFGEKVRRAADLEHWAAFGVSFRQLTDLVREVASGQRGSRAPATVCVLSGDVHHAYIAEAHWPQPVGSRVYQLTCSPVHNGVPMAMRWGFTAGWSRSGAWTGRALRRSVSAPGAPIRWTKRAGPYFGNELATVVLDGREGRLTLERCEVGTAGRPQLVTVAQVPLSWPAAGVRPPRSRAAAD